MDKTYSCPECGNMLLKITKVVDGLDIDHYYCDICNISFKLKQLYTKKKSKSVNENNKKK